jgi:hypothetical protein
MSRRVDSNRPLEEAACIAAIAPRGFDRAAGVQRRRASRAAGSLRIFGEHSLERTTRLTELSREARNSAALLAELALPATTTCSPWHN